MIETRAAVALCSNGSAEKYAIAPVCNAFQQKICKGLQLERTLSEPPTDVIVEKMAMLHMMSPIIEGIPHA
jgi:hypothetical protein